jgi:hypothetical protein
MDINGKLERRLNSLLNFTFKALGAGYLASSVDMVYRTITRNEPIETKVGYVTFAAIGGVLGYYLLNDSKKEENKEEKREEK